MSRAEVGRNELATWTAARPTSYFDESGNLASVLATHAGAGRAAAMSPMLTSFGETVARVVEPAVVTLERHRDLPALVAYDAIGRVREGIEFHPAYEVAGRAILGSGLLEVNRGGQGSFEQAALFYLLSHVGEGGHACPAVCTAGLARAVERRGPDELRDRYLDGLFSTDYDQCLRGSQFLTEVHGGSDVGANAAVAIPDRAEPDAWRISGEKWFCSVADADLFAVTARPEGAAGGTRGLGCFLVPRSLDGVVPNGFRIRRLKDKLGTRCMASAEIDFDDALSWPIGAVEEGFHTAVEELLNASRWLNAVGSTGIMRRAYLEASSFARHRRAFGGPIGEIPIVRSQLASMKVDEHAALSSTLVLTELLDAIDSGAATDEQIAAHRILVNANKYVTSITATDVVHRGIELLGGNGTIEDFSALPRLYRDAIVYESWEGTHNVLSAQVQRDLGRRGMLDSFAAWLRGQLAGAPGDPGRAAAAALDGLEPALRATVDDPVRGAFAFRSHLERVVAVVQAAALLREAEVDATGAKGAVAEAFVRSRLDGRAWHETDARDVDAIVGGDLG